MFELETATKAKLIDVVVLSQKNRQPDENLGAKLSFEMAVGNDFLAYFDGGLKSALFTRGPEADGAQTTLAGVEPRSDMPKLSTIGARVGQLRWELELGGYDLEIDYGLGGASNIPIAACTLSNFRIVPMEGGTCTVKFDAESNDVPEKVFGKLATLKTRDVEILATPPGEAAQGDLVGAK